MASPYIVRAVVVPAFYAQRAQNGSKRSQRVGSADALEQRRAFLLAVQICPQTVYGASVLQEKRKLFGCSPHDKRMPWTLCTNILL